MQNHDKEIRTTFNEWMHECSLHLVKGTNFEIFIIFYLLCFKFNI